MKCILRMLAVLVFFVVVLPCVLPSHAQAAEWTILVYLDADNDLESAGIDDFLEMATVGSNNDINIILQFDRVNGYDTSYGDWKTTKRFRVTRGMTPTAANAISDIGEANMGDPDTLEDFINWGTSAYPANNYALVMWNHGGGWRDNVARAKLLSRRDALQAQAAREPSEQLRRELADIERELREKPPQFLKGVCWDETNGNDYLENREVRQAMDAATQDVDLLGYDACLMGMIEVAYEARNTGPGVMVGSEETEPGDGWPYDTFLQDLANNPTATPAQLATYIVDRYYASYNGETQSAIDLTRMDALATAVSAFATAMTNNWQSGPNTAITTAATAVVAALDTAIIHSRAGSTFPGANGLAIYFPSGAVNASYIPSIIQFANGTWDEFLAAYAANMGGSWVSSTRAATQSFYDPDYLDLYDFAQRVSQYTPSTCMDYSVAQTQYSFTDISSSGTNLNMTDESTKTVNLPFSFEFYGKSYTSVYVSDNGALAFTAGGVEYQNSAIPSDRGSESNTYIAVLHDDYEPDAHGAVFWQVTGAAPNRTLIVQWNQVPHFDLYPSTNYVTFQVALHESDGAIVMNYQDTALGDASYNSGRSATVGIQNAADCGLQYSYNQAVIASGSALRFAPAESARTFGMMPQYMLLLFK